MSVVLGKDAKLYFCAAGTGGTPTWTELTNVKNVTVNLQKGEADVTTRGNNGWRATIGTLKDASVEWEMVWDTEDAGFTAIQEAYFDGTPVEVAVMDGVITESGSEGLRATMDVISFTRSEPLEEAITVSVTLKPTYSANPPEWMEVA